MNELLHGVVVVDKPVGPTSFAVVRQARRITGARKVGHGGTLDPRASGVLPICFGEATKLAQFLLDADKEYEATITFGVETDTYDGAGTVTARRPADHLERGDVQSALTGFLGEQSQVPPMYSALKRDGLPLYAYARAGKTLDRLPRTIRVHALELRGFTKQEGGSLPLAPPRTPPRSAWLSHAPLAPSIVGKPSDGGTILDGSSSGEQENEAQGFTPELVQEPGTAQALVLVRCSKGTYVRSLAHDLGRVLGTGAHLAELRRTRSGPFGLEHAISPEALATSPLPLISPAEALAHLTTVLVSEDVAAAIGRGQTVTWDRAGELLGQGRERLGDSIRILAPDGHLLAVAPWAGRESPIQTLRVFRSLDGSFAA